MLELTTTKERINALHHYVQVELETLGKWTNSKGKRPRRRFWKEADDPKIWIISDSEYSEKELQKHFQTLEETEVVFHPFVILHEVYGTRNDYVSKELNVVMSYAQQNSMAVITLIRERLYVISHPDVDSFIFLIQCKFPDIKFVWSDLV